MMFKEFSKKQMKVLNWWCEGSTDRENTAIICDGAVRSGKTMCMFLSFVLWANKNFSDSTFAVCSKTISSAKRNITSPYLGTLGQLGFTVKEKQSENYFEVFSGNRKNRFYLFGGNDESSYMHIQGITLCGVLLDEVALMPRSFVEQALARCSMEGARFWINCNPSYPRHWFREEWILRAREKKALYIKFKMEDNPSLSKEILARYKSLYTGTFYKRYIEGEWVAAQGLVYPFMNESGSFCKIPDNSFGRYIVSCDYGTVNPTSMGLWGKHGDVWYRIAESYYDSRSEGCSRTDEEHYTALCELVGNRDVDFIVVDPSAASFIRVIERHDRFSVKRADNRVIDGIRMTAQHLRDGDVRICDVCADAIREFGMYRWDERAAGDRVIKEYDHAMDDIRYFVTTVCEGEGDDDFCSIAVERHQR